MAKRQYVITIEDDTVQEKNVGDFWNAMVEEIMLVVGDYNFMTDSNLIFTSQELITAEKGN